MSTIDNLKGAINLGRGLARNNRYSVYIGRPETVAFTDETGIILAESVTMPGRTIATNEFTNNRETMKNPYTFIDDPVSMTFRLTNNYIIRRFFDNWMNEIFDPENYTLSYKSEYTASIVIAQLDAKNFPIYTVELKNAFPVSIASYDLSDNNEGDVTRLTVEFAYDKYQTEIDRIF